MRTKITIFLFTCFLFSDSNRVLACGPFLPQATFTYSLHPDFPLENFAGGELGILQPKYARSYLYVAYRYLTGLDFDNNEQKAVVTFWKDRLYNAWKSPEWIDKWLAARNRVPGLPPVSEIKIYSTLEYSWYTNCLEDAFQSATKTLEQRIKQFGANSNEIRDWVRAQDLVFAQCSKNDAIPALLSRTVHPLLRADRTYQIAAAHFYARHFDIAEKMFLEIAKDTSSPWSLISPYLVARAQVRKATLQAQDTADVKLLADAESKLQTILADDRLKEIHAAAKRLLGFVRFRLRPEERSRELAKALLQKNISGTLQQDLTDYVLWLDRQELTREDGKEDLADWIFTLKRGDYDHALTKWRETASLHWFVVLLANTEASHPRVSEILKAAADVKPGSPAYLTIAYHRVRLMSETGKKADARAVLTQLLSHRTPQIPQSSLNLFLEQRIKLARDLSEFLKYAPRTPTGITVEDEGPELPEESSPWSGRPYFDSEVSQAFNKTFPLEVSKGATQNKSLPRHLRRELAMATWVRAVLLGNEKIAVGLAPTLEQLSPNLGESLRVYVNAANREARTFAGVFAILKYPGMRPYLGVGLSRLIPAHRIDNFRDNWWCSPETEFGTAPPRGMDLSNSSFSSAQSANLDPKVSFPDFITRGQRETAGKELSKLLALDTAPNYLSAKVLRWAKANPDDPRVPEALHLAVRATRYGCTDKSTSKFSKMAFQLLHRRYPKSEWTKKTKFWF